MTTQLRLVEPPEPVRTVAARGSRPQSRARAGAARGTANRSPRTGRRAVPWGDWHLDARTRKVGRAGVASARQALEAAAAARESARELSQAS